MKYGFGECVSLVCDANRLNQKFRILQFYRVFFKQQFLGLKQNKRM